jgi:hypothetical protein
MSKHTTRARDAALQRLSRANRWLIAGSVVLTGVLSDVAANAFAGKTIESSPAGKRGAGSSSPGYSTTPAKPLSPPAQAPQSSESSPSQESSQPAPSQEQQAPSQEASPPAAPSQESSQPAPSQEQQAPSQEASPPAVSGGS